MGGEIMLIVPLIFFIGITIARFSPGWWKIVFFILTLGTMFIFTFVYPAPLGINWSTRKIYWRGGAGINKGENLFAVICRKMDIEFIDKND